MQFEPKIYKFKTNTRWIKERKGVLASSEKKTIEIACPPEFGGEKDYWTAEHLFVASVEICIMTTFKWLLEKSNGQLISYKSEAVGSTQMMNNDFRFSEIEIKPVISVPEKDSFQKAEVAIENACKQCLISKALTVRVRVNPEIRIS